MKNKKLFLLLFLVGGICIPVWAKSSDDCVQGIFEQQATDETEITADEAALERWLDEHDAWYNAVCFGEIDINSQFNWQTALHVAAADGLYGDVCLLLDEGAVINELDLWGQTPLYLVEVAYDKSVIDAETYNRIVELLETAGANSTLQTDLGDSVQAIRARRREREQAVSNLINEINRMEIL